MSHLSLNRLKHGISFAHMLATSSESVYVIVIIINISSRAQLLLMLGDDVVNPENFSREVGDSSSVLTN